ncbi:hypothetical protein SDC9_173538 [bioreactor metagenome]|uniref:Uncharacterized protein n=1 Tax=bioreactor metagenome TaxID=1076179 RepID=A0A645GQ80_9ZZZZ
MMALNPNGIETTIMIRQTIFFIISFLRANPVFPVALKILRLNVLITKSSPTGHNHLSIGTAGAHLSVSNIFIKGLARVNNPKSNG